MENSVAQMIVYPVDGGTAENCDSQEASVMSGTRRWSDWEGWVGWEEEWKIGIILRYYRTWLRFHLPPLPEGVHAALRVHLNRGFSNVGPLRVEVYAAGEDTWNSGGLHLGSLGTLDRFDPQWLEMELPPLLPPAGRDLELELRAASEQTMGFDTSCTAIFDLLPPSPQAELVLSTPRAGEHG